MSTFAKFGGVAAAAIVLAVAGTVMFFGGRVGGDPSGPPSSRPTPGAPTSTTPPATAAPLLPGEFTACVPFNSQLKAGTDSQVAIPSAEGGGTIERRRGFTWSGTITATDPRFAGTHYYSWDGDTYTFASGNEGQTAYSEGHRIENAGGAWHGSASGIGFPDGAGAAGLRILIGEGGYAGLTAVLVDMDGPCFFNYRGLVTEIPAPPVPATGG